jgi:inorganic pyrophosphatase
MAVHPWHDIGVGKKAPKIINAVIEIPKDETIKYELDKETGLLKLDRYMYSAMHYPADYGFIPQTYCDDDDPLDVFVVTHRPTYPMTLCEVKVIGVIRMIDDDEQDDKLIAVHANDPRYNEWNSIKDIPQHFLKEMQHFLERYKDLQGKVVKVMEILDAEEAWKDVKVSMKMYDEKFRK